MLERRYKYMLTYATQSNYWKEFFNGGKFEKALLKQKKYSFFVNTKYISSGEVKLSAFSLVLRTQRVT